MISKLPAWIWTGAWLLSFIAGIVNVIGLLGFAHHAVTHHIGKTSLLGAAIAQRDWDASGSLATLIVAFVAGAVLSGFIIQDSTLRLGRRYGVALLLVSALMLAAAPGLAAHNAWGLYAAACACGLQNAMVSTYSGAVVRTTHLSGMFTDLGIFLGHALRRLPVDTRRLRRWLAVISGFLCGGVVGALLFATLQYAALMVPATLTVIVAAIYGVYRRRQ